MRREVGGVPVGVLATMALVALAVVAALGWVALSGRDGPAAASGPQPAIVLDDTIETYDLRGRLYYLEDPTGQLTVEQVSSAAHDGQFVRAEQPVPSFGYTDSAYWVRLQLRSAAAETNDWRLEVPDATIDEIAYFHFHYADPDRFHPHVTGAAYSVETRDMPAPGFAFQVRLDPGDEQTIYLRFLSRDMLSLPVRLMNVGGFVAHRAAWDFVWGIVFGTFAFLFVYHLVQFLQVRDRPYLYLALIAFFNLTYYVFTTGYGDLYVLGHLPLLYRIVAPFSLMMISLCLTALARDALESRKRIPRLDVVLRGLMVLYLLGLVLIFLQDERLIYAAQFGLFWVGLVTTTLAATAVYRQGHGPALSLLYTMPFGVLLGVSAVLTMPYVTGLDWTHPIIMAMIGLVSLLLLGRVAASRIELLRAERQAARQALARERERYQMILDDHIDMICRLDGNGIITFANRAAQQFYGGRHSLIGANVYDVIPDPAVEVVKAALERIAAGNPLQEIEIELVQGDGRTRWTRWQLRAVYDAAGQLIEYQASGEDITDERRYAAELQRYRGHLEELVDERTAELRHQRTIARSLEQTATALNSSLDLDTVIETVLEQVLVVQPCDGAAILLPLNGMLTAVAAAGASRLNKGRAFPLGDMRVPSMQAFVSGLPIILSDTLDYPEWPGHAENGGIRSLLSVPLRRDEESVGSLTLVSLSPHAFRPEDADLVQAFANHAALAVVNARLYEQIGVEAAAEERERLARELHDSVTQALFSAGILAEAVPLQLQHSPDEGLASVDKLRQLTRGALGEMRTMLVELLPSTMSNVELGTLLGYLADATTARSRTPVEVIAGPELPPMPPEVHATFYRVAQEALGTLSRLGRVRCVRVVLSDEREGICLSIEADGDVGQTPMMTDDHDGLRLIRERAEAIGARLQSEIAPKQGVFLRLIWSEEEIEEPAVIVG